jgi:hypothetical protein
LGERESKSSEFKGSRLKSAKLIGLETDAKKKAGGKAKSPVKIKN